MNRPLSSRIPASIPVGRDPARWVARLACVVLAMLGLLPPAMAGLTRSEPVRRWVAAETARLLSSELGLQAAYDVRLSLWPISLELENVRVDSSDGGSPALVAPRVTIRPRLFALLAGRLDAGHVAVEAPAIRAVLQNGELANVAIRIPETDGPSRLPLSSLAITDGSLEAQVDGVRLATRAVDLDVFARRGDEVEVALRVSSLAIVTERDLGSGGTAVDDDLLCQIDARVRVRRDEVLVPRLSLVGVIDSAPEPFSSPACELTELRSHPHRVLMRLGGFRLERSGDALKEASGHVLLRAPVDVFNRYVDGLDVGGWVGINGELDVSERTRFPEFHGKLKTGPLRLKDYSLVQHSEGEVHLTHDRLLVSRLAAGYADGDVQIADVSIDLLAPGAPISVRKAVGSELTFPGLMRDIDVTENTIVRWDIDRVTISDFSGTLDPPNMQGRLHAETSHFEVFDRSVHDPDKRHMIGAAEAVLDGTFGVHDDSVRFVNMRARFGQSQIRPTVHIGYDNTIFLTVAAGSTLSLADASPLVDIPMAGMASLDVSMKGDMGNPVLTGKLKIEDLVFSGFPIGTLSTDQVRFVPLRVDLAEATLDKGSSHVLLRDASLDFDTDAVVKASARAESTNMDLRDFLSMWHFDRDPRWDDVSGRGRVNAKLSYALGGRTDRCDGGRLRVRGDASLERVGLFGENYSRAESTFDFTWFDVAASYHGMELDVPSLMLQKESGKIVGSARLRPGARVNAELVASAIPLSTLQGLGPLARQAVGTVSGRAEVSGTLDAMQATAQAQISAVRLGRGQLPASQLSVRLDAVDRSSKPLGQTRCGGPLLPEFDLASFEADQPSGVFRVSGQLFGGQIGLDDFQVTRQRSKHARGRVALLGLDLGALSNLSPVMAQVDPLPRGRLDGTLEVRHLALDEPLRADGTLDLQRLQLERSHNRVVTQKPARIEMASGTLELGRVTLEGRAQSGQTGVFDLGGRVRRLHSKPDLDLHFSLRPTPLSSFASLLPAAEQIKGTLFGRIAVTGPLDTADYRGGFQLRGGAVTLKSSPHAISDLDLELAVLPGEVIIEEGAFAMGGGRVQVRGNAPLKGFQLGELRTFITARNVSLPLASGVRTNVDADLRASWHPGGTPGEQRKRDLPRLVGNVTLNSFEYSRPVKLAVDISSLAQRGRRTEFDAYQPDGDLVSFDVNVRSEAPLRLKNNLIDASLVIEDDVLQLAGTNQRFGIRGALEIAPGGQVKLTRNEFEIQQGRVRFDDPTRIAPLVDVTAVTEYRRYGGSLDPTSAPVGGGAAATGNWRVTLHAYGDAETLRVDLSSQPELARDDIVLLLTLGLTRAELDQVQSSNIGESVALEALGALTGADEAVNEAIPVIDEFRFGSVYSSRTGRSEPAITIGKRLSRRIRAFVTSGVAESRDVRSNVEVKINQKVSIEGSYDNVNDISSSALGNIGADLRWRLDFQ